jgi:hypothetical protein
MKSKWKAQKRREGLVTKPLLSNMEASNEENKEESSERTEDGAMREEEISNSGESDDDSESESENENERDDSDKGKNGSDDISDRQNPTVFSRGRATKRGGRTLRGGPSRQVKPNDEQSGKPSLRELQNQAYSRSSLHNFKSGSHHKQGGPGSRNPRGRGGEGSRGGRTRGRGQPDMRLRMNAMLEKIKRDYA